ncbi:MAG: acetyl-CoA carboxylase biotin carboxyl carrier protein subunit [Chloroflexi bacterium]|mgnify:CR=1 FL=1|nr:acetyl-CoA carboxylase biotin carboxyl carrier protein subunit [Chloroflexota bacterium]
MKVIVRVNDKLYEVEIGDLNARPIVAVVEGETFEVWPEAIGSGAGPAPSAAPAPAQVPASAPAAKPQSDASAVHAPIPGVIVSVSVQPGDQVSTGQELCVLEAMKMKNIIRAPRDGEIATVSMVVGQHVQHHQVLVEYAG